MKQLTLLLVLLVATSLSAREVTVAFVPIGDERVERITLLAEARLATVDGITLVDRQTLEATFDEQALAALAGAARQATAAESRQRLGKLSRADVLVVIDAGRGDDLLVTAIDVATGLRLERHEVPAEAAAVSAATVEAIERHRAGIRQVVAVMPFRSEDLSRQRDGLIESFADVLRKRLSQQAGTLVVEVNEARAVATEFDRSDGDEHVERPAATIIDGKFHSLDGDAVRVEVNLRREGRSMSVEHVATSAATAAAWLATADEAVPSDWFETRPPAPAAAAEEAGDLDQRAAEFAKLGDWQQAYHLAEAALLLEPSTRRRQHVALYADEFGDLVRERGWQTRDDRQRKQAEDDERELRERGWDQLVRWSYAEALDRKHHNLIRGYLVYFGQQSAEQAAAKRRDVVGIYGQTVHRANRDAWIKLLDLLNQELFGFERDQAHQKDGNGWLWQRTSKIEGDFNHAIAVELLKMPTVQADDLRELYQGIWSHSQASPEVERRLDRLRDLKHPVADEAVRLLVKEMEEAAEYDRRSATRPRQVRRPTRMGQSEDPAVTLTLVTDWTTRFGGWFVLDEASDTDIFWTVHHDGGKLWRLPAQGEPVLLSEGMLPAGFSQATFDGRWLWHLAKDDQGRARLVAVDARTGERRALGVEHGLPPDLPRFVTMAAVGEGRVAFGAQMGPRTSRRTYVVLASLEPASIDRIIEVREHDQSYRPRLHRLADDDATLVLFRYQQPPLLIDADRPQPIVGEIDLPHHPYLRAVYDFAGHTYVAVGRNTHSGSTFRLDAESLEADLASSLPPRHEGVLVVGDLLFSRSHGGPLQVASDPTDRFRLVPTRWPERTMMQDSLLFRTSRHGFVIHAPYELKTWQIDVAEDVVERSVDPYDDL